MTLGNVPRTETVLTLAARKSFAFGVAFVDAAGDPLDLTGCTVHFALATGYTGSTLAVDRDATILDAVLGQTQVELQSADLDMAEGEYPFALTLISAEGYSTLACVGIIDLRTNADQAAANTYTGINPSTQLAVSIESGNQITVQVASVDGMYVIVQDMVTSSQATLDAKVTSGSAALDTKVTDGKAAIDAKVASVSSDLDAKVTAAAASATDAAGSATAAATSATNAAGSASDAAASAQQAADIAAGEMDPTLAGLIADRTSATRVELDKDFPANVDDETISGAWDFTTAPTINGKAVALANAPRAINNQAGTAYTLVLADAGAFVRLTNAAAITLTVPTNAAVAFPIGTVIEGVQTGAGQVTITPAVGVTVNASPGLKTASQYSTFGLMKVDTNTWLAYGRLSA